MISKKGTHPDVLHSYVQLPMLSLQGKFALLVHVMFSQLVMQTFDLA